MDAKKLGQRINYLRIYHHLNQKLFAERIGITQSTLSCYENGNALPSVDVLWKIANCFGVSLDWLCGVERVERSFSTLSDVEKFFVHLNDVAELRFEIEVDDHLPNDLETETRKWSAAIKFYGNDTEHRRNAEICRFLSGFKNLRQEVETYFISKEYYDWQIEQIIGSHSEWIVTKKEYEEIPKDLRIRLRNKLIMEQLEKEKETK